LTFLREGLGQSISLEYILPHSGEERKKIIGEIDAVALYHYKQKISYEEKLQRRFGKDGESLNIDDQMASELLKGTADFGEVIQEEAGEIGGYSSEFDSSEEESDSSETEYETGSEDGNEKPPPPLPIAKQPNLRPTRSMTFPQPAPVERRNSELPPLPLGAQQNIEHYRQNSQGSSSSLRVVANTPNPSNPIMRSKTAASSHHVPSRLARRPSDSALHAKPPPPPKPTPKSRSKRTNGPEYPQLTAIPQLLPLFVEINRPQLYNYR